MPKATTIKIVASDGREWPCRVTLGAMRRYKQLTGEDVSRMAGVSDITTLIWCCCKSACAIDGVAFDLDVDEFCDRVGIEAATAFAVLIGGEKKTLTATKA